MAEASHAVPPLVPNASPQQVSAILGAMRAIVDVGGPASEADRHAIVGASRYLFGRETHAPFDALAPVAPEQLASALAGSKLAEDAAKFLTVMAFVDGKLDKTKIAAVLGYARALGTHESYLDDIAAAANDRLQEALAHMVRANMESITGRPWNTGDVNQWLLPYSGAKTDPALAARFEALGQAAPDTFGHAFWKHFHENGYAFPGDPNALNAAFCVPHDSAHVLSGYDTSPRGELLVSTFTASMHPHYPMAGHVLPVIFSWHLKVQINPVAKSASMALDPDEFWHAWAGGGAAKVDTFAPDWDFWAHVHVPLTKLRTGWSIPADGLDTPRRPA